MKNIFQIILGMIGAIAGLLGVSAFNQYLLMSLPLGLRMVLMICTYWMIAAVPLGISLFNRDKLADYGIMKEKIGHQILVGIVIGMVMSFFLTLIPIFAGKGDWVDNGHHYQYLWQFFYDFVYFIIAIGFVEEFVFRGFIYNKVQKLSGSVAVSIAVSSILFGLFHFLSGNIVQIVMTCFIGAFFCLCKEKIRHCTLLSVIIAHGVYDALITVWACVF